MQKCITAASANDAINFWDDARLFLAAAEAGNFSTAAKVLGINQSSISRRIAYLEQRIGTVLFSRSRRGAELTEAGVSLLASAKAMQIAAKEWNRHLMGASQELSGVVQISASEGVVSYLLMPMLASFMQKYSQISIQFITNDEDDVNITLLAEKPNGIPAEGRRLKVMRLGRMNFVPFAGQAYIDLIKKNGKELPTTKDELKEHPLVHHKIYDQDAGMILWNQIVKQRLPKEPAVTKVDTTSALHQSIRMGLGIGMLPTYALEIDNTLHRLDINLGSMATDFWLSSHEDSLKSPKVRAVFDYLAEVFADIRKRNWFYD
ncbi:MAG: LysR family transcriptional regulator [Alphaproteobacteria bacterium]